MLRLLKTSVPFENVILLKLYLQEKFKYFWLVVFFKDLHWDKMIKSFDFLEAEFGTGWEIVDCT